MSEQRLYTGYHPRWYRERVSTYWWLWHWRYLKFVLREISSVFVALFVVITLLQVRALAKDRKSTRLNSSHIQKSRMPSSA